MTTTTTSLLLSNYIRGAKKLSRRTMMQVDTIHYPRMIIVALFLLACCSFPVQGQLTLETCMEQLQRADRDENGMVSRVEFMNFIVQASPFAADGCPDMSNVKDFLKGGKYFQVLETASCYCQEYDADAACCLTPSLRIDGSYPQQYTDRICQDVATVVEENCTPTASPTLAPTASPVAAIVGRDDTSTPTLAPTTQDDASDKDDAGNDSGDSAGDDGSGDASRDVSPNLDPFVPQPEDTETGYLSLPLWVRIALPFAALLFIAFCVVLLWSPTRRGGAKSRQVVHERGLHFDDDQDSLKGYPEILEETDVEDTERSIEMEEGAITEALKLEKKVSWNDPLPQPLPKTPSRMSQVLDSLELDETPMPPPPKRKRSSKTKTKTKTKSKSKSKKKATTGSTKKNDADSDKRMSEFVDALDRESRSIKALAAAPSTAPADPRERMGGFFRDSASAASDASASSAEIFMDEQEDESTSLSGATDSSAQIKWRLLHPTTLVNTGAVEVFPLPPAVTNIVVAASSSSSSPASESGESKEEESYEEDSVSDMYHDDSTAEDSSDNRDYQPDPDGVRLEDGRHYREQWLRDNLKDRAYGA